MADVLQVNDLYVSYATPEGEVKAVNGVSFALKEQSILCLVGESGAGKSSIALALMRLLPESTKSVMGKIYFNGLDLLSVDDHTMRQIRGSEISMIPQEPRSALNPILTVETQVQEQILAHTNMSKQEVTGLTLRMLREMGLPDPEGILRRYPFELSGGMCQRVILAMALALRPKVLIADEPTSNLDVTLQAEILGRLKSFCKELGSSMILITHDLGVVAQMADEVAVMYAGTVVEYADVHSLFRHPRHPYMWGLFQAVPRLDRPDMRYQPIHGSPPDLIDLPGECPYLPRCPKAITRCRLEPRPSLEEVEAGHTVACYNRVDLPGVVEEE